jgi:hypothetical protein
VEGLVGRARRFCAGRKDDATPVIHQNAGY